MPTPQVDTIVHGGQVVTSTDMYETSIAIKGGRISALGPRELLPPAESYIDASGKFVLPGAIDAHIHIDSLKCDDWETAPLAAAHSGITSLVAFCIYDDLGGETLPAAINRAREEAEASAVLDCGVHFLLHHQPSLWEGLPGAFGMGFTSYHVFMTYTPRL